MSFYVLNLMTNKNYYHCYFLNKNAHLELNFYTLFFLEGLKSLIYCLVETQNCFGQFSDNQKIESD